MMVLVEMFAKFLFSMALIIGALGAGLILLSFGLSALTMWLDDEEKRRARRRADTVMREAMIRRQDP